MGKNRKTAQKWTKPQTVGMLGTEKPHQNFGKTENRTKNRLEPQNRKPLTLPHLYVELLSCLERKC